MRLDREFISGILPGPLFETAHPHDGFVDRRQRANGSDEHAVQVAVLEWIGGVGGR